MANINKLISDAKESVRAKEILRLGNEIDNLKNEIFMIFEYHLNDDAKNKVMIFNTEILPRWIEIDNVKTKLNELNKVGSGVIKEMDVRDVNGVRNGKRKRNDKDYRRTKIQKVERPGKMVSYEDRNRFYSSNKKGCIVVNLKGERCMNKTKNRVGRMAICTDCKSIRNLFVCSGDGCSKRPAFDNNGVLQKKCENCERRCISCNEKRGSMICYDCKISKICIMCHTRDKVIDDKCYECITMSSP